MLYGEGSISLAVEDMPGTEGITAAFNRAMEWLHGKRIFGAAMLKEKPVRALMEETAAFLAKGIERGIQEDTPSEAMVDSLRESAGVFSGFKTFHEMKEAADRLLDKEGNLKTFEQFSKDVQGINKTYNRHYLKTEYAFAVQSASMASRWEEQQDDGGGRYLLQYRTAGDSKVRKEHREMEGITLPPDDPFWDKYYPPNGWNCRCTVVKVRAAKYPATDSKAAMEAGDKAVSGKHAEMFRFNPGKQRAAYPAYNSYTISKCSTCTKNGLELAKIPSNELCSACEVIHQLVQKEKGKRLTKEERAEINASALKWADRHLPEITLEDGIKAKRLYVKNKALGESIAVNKAFFSETFTKNKNNRRLAETMKLATRIEDWLPEAKHKGVEKGIHHDFHFHIFEAKLDGVTLECKAKITTGIIAYNVRIKKED